MRQSLLVTGASDCASDVMEILVKVLGGIKKNRKRYTSVIHENKHLRSDMDFIIN